MKIVLRIVALLLSLWIVVFASLPPTWFDRDGKDPEKTPKKTSASANAPQSAQKEDASSEDGELGATSQMFYDVLGGAQLETGKRAKDELNKIHEMRQERMGELGGYGKEKE